MQTKELGCTVVTKINLGNFESMDVSFTKTVVLTDADNKEFDETAIRAVLFADVRTGLHEQVLLTKQQLKEQKAVYHA